MAPPEARPVLLLLSLLLTACRICTAFSRAADVPGVVVDATGQAWLWDARGREWRLHISEEHARVYFEEISSGRTVWDDPRTLPLTADDTASLTPELVAQLEANYTRLLQEAQPGLGLRDPAPRAGHAVTFVTAAVPLVVLACAVTGRIWYLHTHHPDLLFPNKERKLRRKQRQKFRPQKARGKMSQDGKGGRSANS